MWTGTLTTLLLLLTAWAPAPVTAGFPAGKCTQRACDRSPYSMAWTTSTSPLCFLVGSASQSCNRSGTDGCCSLFENTFRKLVITSPPECSKSVRAVRVNGVLKGGGVYFDVYDATHGELRLTNMLLNSSTAPDTLICITTTSPCETLASFCRDPRGTGACKFAVYDPYAHVCCPTCPFGMLSEVVPELPEPELPEPEPEAMPEAMPEQALYEPYFPFEPSSPPPHRSPLPPPPPPQQRSPPPPPPRSPPRPPSQCSCAPCACTCSTCACY
jgi:hypothetical protein